MKRPLYLFPIVVAALAVAACDSESPTGLEDSLLEHRADPPGHSRYVTVMTRNLYIGADVDPIIEAAAAGQLDLIPGLVDQAFATMVYTNYPERAGAIADEILAADPDLIGVQEAYVIQGGGQTLDFIGILQQHLLVLLVQDADDVGTTHCDLTLLHCFIQSSIGIECFITNSKLINLSIEIYILCAS